MRVYVACLLVLGVFALADDPPCTTTEDLARDLGPNFDQGGGLAWCHSFALSDMLTFAMHKRGLLARSERLHPVGLASAALIAANLDPGREAGRYADPNGVRDSLWAWRGGGGKMCTEGRLGPVTTSKHPMFALGAAAAGRAFREELRRRRPKNDCHLTALVREDLDDVDAAISEVSRLEIRRDLEKTCDVPVPDFAGRALKLAPAREGASPDKQNELMKALDHDLEVGNLPAIRYQAGFLLKSGSDFSHYSTVTQRKMIGGVCHYRIRDSYGPDCARFLHPEKCEGGSIWVERGQLLAHAGQEQSFTD